MRKRTVVVNDKMQTGYRYVLSAPVGRSFDPEFKPELTPRQMLRLGVFCGKYMTDARKEFPKSWFAGANLAAGRFSYPMPMGMACSTSTMMARMMMLQMVAPIPAFMASSRRGPRRPNWRTARGRLKKPIAEKAIACSPYSAT